MAPRLGAKTRETGKAASVGEDKAYDAEDPGKNLGKNLRAINVTPHVARNNGTTKTGKLRKTIIDDATAASEAYGMSQTRRKMIECIFGWGKQLGTMRKTKHRGLATVAGVSCQHHRLQPDPHPQIARRLGRSPSKPAKQAARAGETGL